MNKDISSKFDNRKGILFEPNNILYGKLRPYLKNWLFTDFKGIALGDFWVFEAKNSSPNFCYYLIQTDKYQKVANDTSGTKMPRSDWRSVSKTDFYIPYMSEQERIGNFFKYLDNTIALHQRKLKQLELLKRALLQKSFPKTGETVPELRFTNFNESWEQRKLSDVSQITMGQSPNGENYTENSDDHILVQGNADMKNGRVSPRIWTTQITKTAEPNDIILSVRAPVGDVGKTDYNVVLGRGVAGIRGNDFIYQSLIKMKDIGFWTRFSTGSTFESINSTDLKEALLLVPLEEEQYKIADFFKSLDDTIVLYQIKINGYQQFKKSLLTKMFI
ncbi:restriction endonuclease subunit S [Jeotgalibaca sp. PTS2502]|uniref:restriction endonuclease subunit S n=1 Tax=Jeotgalibaca sp. PTS2502 TaxID=1903686 RepID=UPI001E45FAFC|nr:restriction endonuclease subunit S [Jeotgalibaca sp. PTS2502]